MRVLQKKNYPPPSHFFHGGMNPSLLFWPRTPSRIPLESSIEPGPRGQFLIKKDKPLNNFLQETNVLKIPCRTVQPTITKWQQLKLVSGWYPSSILRTYLNASGHLLLIVTVLLLMCYFEFCCCAISNHVFLNNNTLTGIYILINLINLIN